MGVGGVREEKNKKHKKEVRAENPNMRRIASICQNKVAHAISTQEKQSQNAKKSSSCIITFKQKRLNTKTADQRGKALPKFKF